MRRTSNRSQQRLFREEVLNLTPKNAKIRRFLSGFEPQWSCGMEVRVRRKRNVWNLLKGLLVPCGAGVILLWFAAALDGLQGGQEAEDLRQLEEALRRGCVACYAAEGIYPPSLEYLKDYYGIQVNEERYTVYYDAFAENLMPSITVLEN